MTGEVGQIVKEAFECDGYSKSNGDDIWDTKKLIERMKGKDLVVHLAAYAHPYMKHADGTEIPDEEYWHMNYEGTKQVVECMEKAGVKKIIFMSSGGVYGFSTGKPFVKYLPIDEQHPINKENLTTYDKTKLACEDYLTNLDGIKAYIFRLEAPGLIDLDKAVFPGHLFAHVMKDNLIELLRLASEYEGKSDVFNAGDAHTNKFCPDTIAFARENYPDAEIKLKSGDEPLISVNKAKEVLGYKGNVHSI